MAAAAISANSFGRAEGRVCPVPLSKKDAEMRDPFTNANPCDLPFMG